MPPIPQGGEHETVVNTTVFGSKKIISCGREQGQGGSIVETYGECSMINSAFESALVIRVITAAWDRKNRSIVRVRPSLSEIKPPVIRPQALP